VATGWVETIDQWERQCIKKLTCKTRCKITGKGSNDKGPEYMFGYFADSMRDDGLE